MFIKRGDIENSISWVSRRKSKDIFEEYVEKLRVEGKKQLQPHLLPKEWFIKSFSKDYGLSIDEITEQFKTVQKEEIE